MTVSVAREAAAEAPGAQGELLLWGWISFGALAVAGVFALLLALSRIPGLGAVFPVDFFYKGLVIHVIFSLVVWLLANLGFHMSAAYHDLASDGAPGKGLGRVGPMLTLAAFPFLFVPAFFVSSHAELTNYIPLIDHNFYDFGLALLALGLLAPALRLLINLRGRKLSELPLEQFGAAAMAWIYVMALLTFALAALVLLRRGDFVNSREQFNWGGGHLLQFAYAALLLTNWALLARRIFGEKLFDADLIRMALMLLAVFTVPSLGFYIAFDPFSDKLHDAYRLLQFGIGFPAALAGVTLLAGALKTGAAKNWSWCDPSLVALALSVVLFGFGGLMGLSISGSDTRTPAHYHAVITAVSLSCMGVLLGAGFARLNRATVSEKWARVFSAVLWRRAGDRLARHVRRRRLWRAAQDAGSLGASFPCRGGGHGRPWNRRVAGGDRRRWRGDSGVARAVAPGAMKRVPSGAILLLALAAILFAAAGFLHRRNRHPPLFHAVAVQAPIDLAGLVDDQGAPVAAEKFRGKWLIVNLWAPWCAPCLKEMPTLDRLAGDPAFADFAVLAVARDQTGQDKALAVFERLSLTRLKFIADPEGGIAKKIGARGFPTTLVLAPDGAPQAFHEGELDWDQASVRAELSALTVRRGRYQGER